MAFVVGLGILAVYALLAAKPRAIVGLSGLGVEPQPPKPNLSYQMAVLEATLLRQGTVLLDLGESVPETSDAVELPYMYGRLGDSLNQLMWCILWAEENSMKLVQIHPRGWKKLEGFLYLKPDKRGMRHISIDPHPQSAQDAPPGPCTRNFNGLHFYCPSDVRARRRVMLNYVKPLLVSAAKDDMRRRDVEELVIHVRSGDAWSKFQYKEHPLIEYNMPPCAFYDRIIETGKYGQAFNHVRVITERDFNNPCIQEIQKRHPNRNVTVQSTSREIDAAALINARYLVSSQSYFSWMLVLMNEAIETLFVTNVVPERFPDGVLPCGSRDDTRVVTLTIPGLEAVRVPAARKRAWMTSYSEQGLSMWTCSSEGPALAGLTVLKEA